MGFVSPAMTERLWHVHLLSPQVMNGPDQVPIKVVKREIAFSAAARHANIVRLLDVFAEKAQLIIVVSLSHCLPYIRSWGIHWVPCINRSLRHSMLRRRSSSWW
jgi:hypothetical protein